MHRERRTTGIWITALSAAGILAACGEEPPPTSVTEFMENSILLEATMVRCVENRAGARYDAECMNAREAVDRIAAAEERARRAELEAQSERKRQALRRAQEAAAEARRRAVEEERRREEAEYLGRFTPLPDADGETGADAAPETPPTERTSGTSAADPETGTPGSDDGTVGMPAKSAPDAAQPTVEESTDLDAIRRELERRQAESDEQQDR